MDGDPELQAFIERLPHWAERRPDICALALVGSRVYGAPRPDSDLDVLLLTEAPSDYVEREDWLEELGVAQLVRTSSWGAVVERRFALPSGLEIDLGIGTPAWATIDPPDSGTRKVISDGMRILYDPDGLLAALLVACADGN